MPARASLLYPCKGDGPFQHGDWELLEEQVARLSIGAKRSPPDLLETLRPQHLASFPSTLGPLELCIQLSYICARVLALPVQSTLGIQVSQSQSPGKGDSGFVAKDTGTEKLTPRAALENLYLKLVVMQLG